MGFFSNKYHDKKCGLFFGKKIQKQLHIDYSQYSVKDLFFEFKSENWSSRLDENKIATLQELEKREAASHNREVAKVVQINSGSGNLGGYDSGTNTIYIRLTNNQFEVLDTLFHESEHANQSRASIENVNFSENDKKLMRIEGMISSNGSKTHYDKYNTPLYEVMTSELDANNAAIEKMSSLKEEFKDEVKYQMYLEERQNYYAILSDKISLNADKKDAALLDTVESAYIRYELSEEEYNDLQNMIKKESYDMCEKRSLEICESISQTNIQDKTNIENLSLERNSQEEIFKDNIEIEGTDMEEKTMEELAEEKKGSAMLKELENIEAEDINLGEKSAMIDYLDSGVENNLMENESAMTEDLGELETIDDPSLESNDTGIEQ